MIEVFKEVEGYEGLYSISNIGRLRNDKTNRLLKPWIDKDGYLIYDLSKNKVRKHYKAHRLVAQAFILNPNNYPQVNHKDEDKTNNKVSNLEWCTFEYNNKYGTRVERSAFKHRKSISKYDLTGNYISTYKSLTEAANLNNLFKGHISNVALGKQKTAGGFIWKYEK